MSKVRDYHYFGHLNLGCKARFSFATCQNRHRNWKLGSGVTFENLKIRNFAKIYFQIIIHFLWNCTDLVHPNWEELKSTFLQTWPPHLKPCLIRFLSEQGVTNLQNCQSKYGSNNLRTIATCIVKSNFSNWQKLLCKLWTLTEKDHHQRVI